MDYKEQVALIRGLAYEWNKCSHITKIGGMKLEEFLLLTATVITDLLARAEAAEDRAEKAERERDAAIDEIPKICYYCKHRKGWRVCEDWNGSREAETCKKWEWRGQKEE